MRILSRAGALAASLALALALGAGPATLAAAGTAPATQPASHRVLVSRLAFHDAMRKLWEDHITWTRLFIVSFATEPAPLPDLDLTTARLLQNQVDIGNAVKPFYGTAAGNRLTALLREHILLAARILAAARADDSAGVSAASTAWYANANEIAAFLHAANPRNWSLAEMRSMMKRHLDLTLEEATARLQGRYADDIAAYDKVHAEILEMADMLSNGLIRQFPQDFTR